MYFISMKMTFTNQIISTNFYLTQDFTGAYTFASLSGTPTQDKPNGILYL